MSAVHQANQSMICSALRLARCATVHLYRPLQILLDSLSPLVAKSDSPPRPTLEVLYELPLLLASWPASRVCALRAKLCRGALASAVTPQCFYDSASPCPAARVQ